MRSTGNATMKRKKAHGPEIVSKLEDLQLFGIQRDDCLCGQSNGLGQRSVTEAIPQRLEWIGRQNGASGYTIKRDWLSTRPSLLPSVCDGT